MGSTGTDGERFIDNKRITGAIPDMLDEAVEFVRKNSRMYAPPIVVKRR